MVDYNASFQRHKFAKLYGSAALFKSKFYKMDKLVSNPNIKPLDYKSLYPIFVFDVSKQSKRLKTQVTDIQVKASFSANVPANTQANVVVISDRLLSFQSDGSKNDCNYVKKKNNLKFFSYIKNKHNEVSS